MGSANAGRGAQRDLRKGVSAVHYVSSLFPLLGFEDLELHDFTFVQSSEAFGFDRGEVDEHVFTFWSFDEAITLRVVEPFDGPLHAPTSDGAQSTMHHMA